MGRAIIKMPDEFLLKISKLGNKTDEIIPKVLDAGAMVVFSKVKSNLLAVIGNSTKEKTRSTGELAGALGISPVGQDRDGNYDVKIGFDEPRKSGVSNAMLANIIEYGKSGQAPKPFLNPAKTASKKECIDAMKTQLEKEIDSI